MRYITSDTIKGNRDSFIRLWYSISYHSNPHTYKDRNECKELSVFNIDAPPKNCKQFNKLFDQGHTSCRSKCPHKMYS